MKAKSKSLVYCVKRRPKGNWASSSGVDFLSCGKTTWAQVIPKTRELIVMNIPMVVADDGRWMTDAELNDNADGGLGWSNSIFSR